MLQRQEETRLAEASELGTARIIDRAIPPEAPLSGNVAQDARVGAALGLFVGIGLAMLLGYMDRSVKNIKDLEDRVGLPVYGAIPEIVLRRSEADFKSWLHRRRLHDPARLLVENFGLRSRAAEAYRALRTSIQFAMPGVPSHVFLVTSSGPREGKSLTIANLAIAMAEMERRILVVDADLRKLYQDRLFGLGGQVGVTEILAKGLSWREAVKPTQVPNVDLIPAGQIPPNPTELLTRDVMRGFLEDAKQHYDLITAGIIPRGLLRNVPITL